MQWGFVHLIEANCRIRADRSKRCSGPQLGLVNSTCSSSWPSKVKPKLPQKYIGNNLDWSTAPARHQKCSEISLEQLFQVRRGCDLLPQAPLVNWNLLVAFVCVRITTLAKIARFRDRIFQLYQKWQEEIYENWESRDRPRPDFMSRTSGFVFLALTHSGAAWWCRFRCWCCSTLSDTDSH